MGAGRFSRAEDCHHSVGTHEVLQLGQGGPDASIVEVEHSVFDPEAINPEWNAKNVGARFPRPSRMSKEIVDNACQFFFVRPDEGVVRVIDNDEARSSDAVDEHSRMVQRHGPVI